MRNNVTGQITLTQPQLHLLLAIFKDCREFYTSRAEFDSDYRRLSRATLMELYTCYKELGRVLCEGNFPYQSALLVNWTLHAGTPAREIRAYRQLMGIYSRLEGFCSTEAAIDGFVTRVAYARGTIPDGLRATAQSLVEAWLGPAPELLDLHPKHGPGAVAESIRDPREKAYFHSYYPQLDAVGGVDLLYLNQVHKEHAPRDLKVLKHPTTKVVCVPKDFIKPRIISCEPLLMQFLQQAVSSYMMTTLEARCPYVRFRDQTVNQLLAKNLSCATLDMSNASDTVSRRLVWQLFPADWRKLLFALRSRFARLPDNRLVPIRAFAPMGSALCFPVESVVFAAVTVAIALNLKGPKWVKDNAKSFAIYGDDIIAPVEIAADLIRYLPLMGFTPNEQKCCYKSTFRESCGAEWYGEGREAITIVRPRTLNALDTSNLDRSALAREMPMVTHANALYAAGFISAAQLLASLCRFPVAIGKGAGYADSGLSWPCHGKLRHNRDLQRLEQQTLLPCSGKRRSDASSGYENLFLGLVSGWSSKQALHPVVVKPRTKWVLAAPLADR